MKHILYITTLIFLTSACGSTASLISIDVLEPAAISSPTDVRNVLIVDNSPSQKNESVTVNGEKNDDTNFITTDSVKAVMLKALDQFMSEEKYFDKTSIYPRNVNASFVNEIKSLTARKAQSISMEKDADMLIVLDLFTVSATSEYVNTEYFEGFNLLTAKIGAVIRTYDHEGKPFSEPFLLLDSLYRQNSTTWVDRSNSIEQMNDLVYEIAVHSADRLSRVFVPSWKTYNRIIYTGNSSQMKSATTLATKNQWKKAADIWAGLYETEKNRNKRIRLASNIALANEYLDDIENALWWIEEAYKALPSGKSKSELSLQVFAYRSDLMRRRNNMPKLYNQLGIESVEDTDTE